MSFATQPPQGPTFIQGVVFGQLLLIVGLVFLFRFFYVADMPESVEQQRRKLIERTTAQQKSLAARCRSKKPESSPYPPNSLYDVLSRSSYDITTHAPESLDWLSVMAAQIIAGYRMSIIAAAHNAQGHPSAPLPSLQSPEKAAAKQLLERVLNSAISGHTLNLLDHLTITDIDFGSQFPHFSNARVNPDATNSCGVRLLLTAPSD